MANTTTKTDFLSTIVARLKTFFSKAVPVLNEVTAGAVKAQPIVDVALTAAGAGPEAVLYNTVSSAVQSAEVAAAAAGEQSGTGAQKAAAVLSNPTVQNAFTTFENALGIAPHSTTQQTQYINAVVTTLQSLNGTASPAATATTGNAAAASTSAVNGSGAAVEEAAQE